MDKFPVLWNNRAVGELCVEQAGSYTEFSACCQLPSAALWCVWLVGEGGELRLGVIENTGFLRRQFSHQMTASLGKLQRGELRLVGKRQEVYWEQAENPAELFQTPWLRQQLGEVKGAFFHRRNRQLALPYDARSAFPLMPLFCFARICTMRGRQYVVYRFDEKEMPLFP